MKKYLSSIFVLLLMSFVACSEPGEVNEYSLTPAPAEVQSESGVFKLSGNINFYADQADTQLYEMVQRFADRLTKNFDVNIKMKDKSDRSRRHAITFRKVQNLEKEEYQIEVKEKSVDIVSSSFSGFYYAVQTLCQLMPENIYANASSEKIKDAGILCVKISDKPRFKYRGVLLDVSRYFYTVDQMKQFIDLMGQSKLNRLQWHLTDDQGWRIEIKKYPKLTEIGSVRQRSQKYWNVEEFDETVHQGFYTQEEVKEIVKYAQDRGIVIIPEIEIPGHAMAALASYPELSCGLSPKYEVSTTWGIHKDVYCPKESTFKFWEDVFTELFDLFPSEYYHVGGDECPKDVWKKCPVCQKRIKDEGLKDEFELQSYVIKRVEKFLNKHGKQIIGWDEICQGGLAPNASVTVRNGEKVCREVVDSKHKVVVTYAYLDYHQVKPEESIDKCIPGGILTLKDTYTYKVVPDSLSEEQQKYIIGTECCLWGETIPNEERRNRQLYPRLFAFSEVAWSDTTAMNYDNFLDRLPVSIKRLNAQGIKPYPLELKK